MITNLVSLALLLGGINWIDDYDKGLKLAKSEWKPIVMYFGSPTCGGCRVLKSGALSDENVIKESSKYIFVHVDLEAPDNKTIEVFQKYSSEGAIPQLSFLLPTGKEVSRLQQIGPLPADKLIEKMNILRSEIAWIERYDDAAKVAKKFVKPILAVVVKDKDDLSEDLLFEFEKLHSVREFNDKVVWLKIQVKDKSANSYKHPDGGIEVKSFPSLVVIDPYTIGQTGITVTAKISKIREELSATLKQFDVKYKSVDLQVCKKCSKIATGKDNKCHDEHMQNVKYFYCSKCEKPSVKDGKCCDGKDRTAVTE